jgi:hypothetical protein
MSIKDIFTNEVQTLIGVLLLLVLTVSVVSIPIIMFPILKKQNERFTLGYVGARIFEGITISALLLVTLSREFENATVPVASYFETLGVLILGLSDWVGILENIPYCLGAMMFYYLLYQSKLVPR